MKTDVLEKLARTERKKLVDTAIATGTVEKDAFDYVERLSKLAAEGRRARRWLIPFIVIILFTVFLVLLVKEQQETEIELDLTVNALHVRLPVHEQLTGDQFLRSVRASGLNGIEMDGVEWTAPNGSTCSVRIELVQPAPPEQAITLTSLAPPAAWEVGISRAGYGTEFEFTAAPGQLGGSFGVSAVLRGKANLRTDCTSDGTYRSVEWSGPDRLILRIGTATTLQCESPLPVKFVHQIAFENLRLFTIERVQIDSDPIDRRRSSLLSGTLYMDALDAKAVALRPFEDLSFSTSKGYIRAISLPAESKMMGDALYLKAHATVQRMHLGSGANERSLMPGWLEVLSAKTGIALLWASVTYFLGIIYALLQWFKVTE